MADAQFAQSGQIIITGASKGIGASIAKELDARGLSVACLSRSGDAQVGRGYSCDMTDEAAVRATIDAISKEAAIIGLVNNAGLHLQSPSSELPTEEYETVMRLNTTAVMIASREVYPHLKTGGGKIVNIGSFFDKLGVAGNVAYCASKAAVGAITRCLAVEWAADGIGVMNVAPGYIETNLNRDFLASDKVQAWLKKRVPIGRAGTVEEVARLVAALLVEDIPFLTGETIYLDGGQGMNH